MVPGQSTRVSLESGHISPVEKKGISSLEKKSVWVFCGLVLIFFILKLALNQIQFLLVLKQQITQKDDQVRHQSTPNLVLSIQRAGLSSFKMEI